MGSTDDKFARLKAWRESLERLVDSRQEFHCQTMERKTVAAGQLDDARCEHKTLQEAINTDVKATEAMDREIEELKSRISRGTMTIEKLKEDVKNMKTEIESLKLRKLYALASTSTNDCELIDQHRRRLKALVSLTGVRLDPSQERASRGYVVNNTTNKAKIFKTNNLTDEEATSKIWRAMEHTTVFTTQNDV